MKGTMFTAVVLLTLLRHISCEKAFKCQNNRFYQVYLIFVLLFPAAFTGIILMFILYLYV